MPGARNIQFAAAYTGDCSHLLFVDADVSWEPGTLERYVEHDVDLLVGVYPGRADGAAFPVRTFPEPMRCVDPHSGRPRADGLIKVAAGPGGFMLISRLCMQQMVAAYAETWYREKEVPGGKAWNLFEFAMRDHERFGEDINFCLQYGRIGGTVWCDPHLVLHHHGDTTFTGPFIDHLKAIGRMVDHAPAPVSCPGI